MDNRVHGGHEQNRSGVVFTLSQAAGSKRLAWLPCHVKSNRARYGDPVGYVAVVNSVGENCGDGHAGLLARATGPSVFKEGEGPQGESGSSHAKGI